MQIPLCLKNQTVPACCWWVRIMDGDSSGLQLRLCKNQGNLPWKNRAGADARHLPYQQKDGALPADKRLVPCIDTGKKTRQYIINTKDVITYLKKRQSQPEKFSAPTGYYSASWNKGGKPKMLTLREWANLDTAKSRKKFQDFLTLKMQPYSDVLSVAEASRLTGYHHNTLTNWCHNGYIRYFEISGGYMIPKSCLLNFFA